MKTLPLEEWKQLARDSVHVRPGECVYFPEPNDRGIIYALIGVSGPIQTITIGTYFTKDSPPDVKAGSGWVYD